MPWRKTDSMKEKTKFLLEWERRWDEGEGVVNISALCRQFGISRRTGYDWIERYHRAGHDLAVVEGRSTRPHTLPTKVSDDVEDIVAQVRKEFPKYGPKKLRALIINQYPRIPVPAPSTIGIILQRRGLCTPRKRCRVRRSTPFSQPFADVVAANTTWCVDFKGQFKMKDGRVCYALTILDAHSRFLIRCEALLEPTAEAVQRIFDSAFQEFGVPEAIRSDNGPPFASTGPGSLTTLSVWWLTLGIRHERIEPGKPQQNGRTERFHRTLKAACPPALNLRVQQRSFDLFRREYNQTRPHEALGQKPPAKFYERSRRTYPRKLRDLEYVPWHHYLTVSPRGYVTWNGTQHFLGSALRNNTIELRPAPGDLDGEHFEAFFFDILVGHMKLSAKGWQLSSPPTRKRSR
jgi:transposase InsO family protein